MDITQNTPRKPTLAIPSTEPQAAKTSFAPNPSKIKESLHKAEGNCPTALTSPSLSQRSAQLKTTEDYLWLKPETYTLAPIVIQFTKQYNEWVDFVQKKPLTNIKLSPCTVEADLVRLSNTFKSLSPLSSPPPTLADQYNLYLTADTFDQLLDQISKLSQRYLEETQAYEAKLQNLDLNQALLAIEKFYKKYSEYKAEQDKINNLLENIDTLKALGHDCKEPEISLQETENKAEVLKKEYESFIHDLEKTKNNLRNFAGRCVSYRVLASYLQERKTYLETNQEGIQFLKNHFFDLRVHPYQRYKDDFKKAWLDLMPAEYYIGSPALETLKGSKLEAYSSQILLLGRPIYAALGTKVSAYHAVPKDDASKLNERHKALKSIAQSAADLLKDNTNAPSSSERSTLQSIIVRCNLKADYLNELIHLKKEALARIQHVPTASNLPPSLFVINTITQALHDLDPQKRYGLEDLHQAWKEELSQDPNLPDFWLWLEVQDTASLSKDLRHTFISRGLKHVQFINGLAHNELFRSFKPDSKGLVEDGAYVYNIAQDGDLYIVPFDGLKQFRDTSRALFKNPLYSAAELHSIRQGPLNHDTIWGGGNILCAGIVKFKSGKITHIDTNSGHYKPDLLDHLRPALSYFLEKNPGALDDSTNISDYDGKMNTSYGDFKVHSKPNTALLPPKRPDLTLEDLGFKSS